MPGPAGYLVLDVDTKNGARGDEELHHLEHANGALPETLRHTSVSGGAGIWLRKGDRYVGGANLAPNVEVRADDGFIMAPGSWCRWGSWEWDGGYGLLDGLEADHAPRWVLDRLLQDATVERVHVGVVPDLDPAGLPESVRALLDEKAEPGTRSTRTYAFVATCLEAGLDDPDILAAVRLFPPAIDKRDVDRHAQRALNKAKANGVGRPLDDPLVSGAGDERQIDSFFVGWDSFWTKDRREAEWLYEDVLAKGRGQALYAAHKTGKSLLMLWVAYVLAVKLGVVVIYLDYEMGEDDLYERLEDLGCGPDTDLSRLQYALLPSLPPLDQPEGAKALLERVDAVAAQWRGHDLALVIDTTGRAVAGEENSADTIRGFYRHTGLGLKQRGITWARLDHAGKDASKGQRGSSAKGDDVDVVWKVTRTDDGLQLRRDASRMSWVREKVTFRQQSDPLRFEPVDEGWPAGTAEVAAILDTLEVPIRAGARPAGKALGEAGHGRRQNVIQAAQRYRRQSVSEELL